MDDYYDDYASEDEPEDFSTKPVPIWLSICLVIGYIVGGAFLFKVRFLLKAFFLESNLFNFTFVGMGRLDHVGQFLLLFRHFDNHWFW